LSQIEALDLADGSQQIIASAARIQGLTLSPAGGWVAYTVTFSGDTSQDGLYVASTTGTSPTHLNVFGAFTWRSASRLLIIPLEPDTTSNRLLEYSVDTSATRPLTSPSATLFQIAGGNWTLSPDGQRLAFVSAADHNLWVLDLPE
jgi:Tol biopolymer transport system component